MLPEARPQGECIDIRGNFSWRIWYTPTFIENPPVFDNNQNLGLMWA
jgi:hypothetical protein